MASAVAIACVPEAIPKAERAAHFALARRLVGERALDRNDLADGYDLRFAEGDFAAVAKFVDNERRCCPFVRFLIAVEPERGGIALRMTGPAGTRAVLDSELGFAAPGQACRCDAHR